MDAALTTLENLMRRYDHVYFANLVMIAARTLNHDPQKACDLVLSDEWWLGKDALSAVDLSLDGGFTLQAREDAKTFRQALIDIYQFTQQQDRSHREAELITAQFHKWLESLV